MISADETAGKVTHVNYVSGAAKAKGLEARAWAAVVTDVVGGKVRPHVIYDTIY